ncbi:MAG TPA: hypothetical protein VHM89_10285, partial [Acidimicrobiales bacterium]|nr:hypothetical protein [Acidimicrobiales bacterium]HEX2700575.1 hypothetical protein [Acidimicrobiales bacterium]
MLEALKEALDGVCAGAATLGDADGIIELHRCLARLEAATTVATAAFDAGGQWGESGARSAP